MSCFYTAGVDLSAITIRSNMIQATSSETAHVEGLLAKRVAARTVVESNILIRRTVRSLAHGAKD